MIDPTIQLSHQTLVVCWTTDLYHPANQYPR